VCKHHFCSTAIGCAEHKATTRVTMINVNLLDTCCSKKKAEKKPIARCVRINIST
jgi:hypothetical protein